ncbi:MAG: sugar transferase [Alphaproteobacteria bacterium]|nr:sugar transferase [Alphaproteobacteria bacterium]
MTKPVRANRAIEDAAALAPTPAHGFTVPRFLTMSGYVPKDRRAYRVWNLCLVVPLILFTLPLMILIALVLALAQGPRNVIYRGARLGLDQKPFHILKFQTLRAEAAQMTKDKVLPAGTNLETPIGKHLRDTRLDELPQLFNVLKGDMNLLGPRPVRPSIAAIWRQAIPGYDLRFKVTPGLVGYTQALMPHSADKAIRARVNAMLCRRPVSLVQEVLFLGLTGLSVLRWTGRVAMRRFRGGQTWRGEAMIDLPGESGQPLTLVHIDGEYVQVESESPLSLDRSYGLLLRRRWRFRPVAKCARCTGVPVEICETGGDGAAPRRWLCTLRYTPRSPLHRYLIERYFTERSLVA